MARSIKKIYGTALYEAGLSSGNLSRLYEDVRFVQQCFRENPGLMSLLLHPRITREEKLETLSSVFSDRVSTEMMGLFSVVTEKDRQAELQGILETFLELTKEHLQIGICEVSTPNELNQAEKDRIEKKILSTTSYRSLEMHYHVEPELLGGMVIRLGDTVVDSSIRTKLQKMQRELTSIQLSTEV